MVDYLIKPGVTSDEPALLFLRIKDRHSLEKPEKCSTFHCCLEKFFREIFTIQDFFLHYRATRGQP